MTSPRFGRFTKGRVFAYVVFVLATVAVFACYKNATSALEQAEKEYHICRQEQENISQQLQVVFEYKLRLETSLQSEKVEHLHAKTDFTKKLNEEKLKCDKGNSEAKLRFSTLQQHYNLLQTQHDDFKEDCSKVQRDQLDTINQLQAKLKEVQEQLKMVTNDKENSIHLIKAQKEALVQDNNSLKERVTHLLNVNRGDQAPVQRTEFSSTSFNKLIPLGDAHYVVPEEKDKHEKALALNERNENDAVLPVPAHLVADPNAKSNLRVSTPKTSPKVMNILPLNAPSATPKTKSKSSTRAKKLLLPLPYQNVPEGVVPAPDLNVGIADESKDKDKIIVEDIIDERYKNVGEKPDEGKKDELKNQFNHQADNENGANEVFDLPNNNNLNNDNGKEGFGKKHIDELNADNNEYDGQNLIDEGEDGDDAADGANPLNAQDEAIRN